MTCLFQARRTVRTSISAAIISLSSVVHAGMAAVCVICSRGLSGCIGSGVQATALCQQPSARIATFARLIRVGHAFHTRRSDCSSVRAGRSPVAPRHRHSSNYPRHRSFECRLETTAVRPLTRRRKSRAVRAEASRPRGLAARPCLPYVETAAGTDNDDATGYREANSYRVAHRLAQTSFLPECNHDSADRSPPRSSPATDAESRPRVSPEFSSN